jgi:predicted transposase/invertase (TIGR01784 family)
MAKEKTLKFSDNLVFSWVMTHHPNLCKEVISTILGIEIADLSYVNDEESVSASFDSKGIRVDVVAKEDGKIYDIEMQTVKKGNLRKRARYYQSVLDIATLKGGDDYESLPESYVIFICVDDFLGEEKALLDFSAQALTAADSSGEVVKLNDGRHIVFLAASLADQLTSEKEELACFLKYVSDGNVDGILTSKLADAVYDASKSREALMWITREHEIKEYKEALKERDAELREKDVKLAEKDAQIAELKKQLESQAKNS